MFEKKTWLHECKQQKQIIFKQKKKIKSTGKKQMYVTLGLIISGDPSAVAGALLVRKFIATAPDLPGTLSTVYNT